MPAAQRIVERQCNRRGLFRVRVYPGGKGTTPSRDGTGLFARDLVAAMPALPVEEEGRLNDMPLRENFIERVFAHHRWTEFLAGRPRPKDLVAFHASEKMTLLAHSPAGLRELGRIVAKAGSSDFAKTLEAYGLAFLEVLRQRATARKHTNVLHHLLGFLKKTVDSDSRQELAERIDEYRTIRLMTFLAFCSIWMAAIVATGLNGCCRFWKQHWVKNKSCPPVKSAVAKSFYGFFQAKKIC